MLERLAKKYIEETKFGKKESALFYLGGMIRPLEKTKVWNRAFIKDEFENNVKVLYSQTVLKLAELDLEEGLAWAMKGFLDNYTDDVEEMEMDEKRFYLISGASFYFVYGVLGATTEDEWMELTGATRIWGLGESTLRSAIHRGRFEEGDTKKIGNTWVVRRSAMMRLYGEPKNALDIDRIEDVLESQNLGIDFESFDTGDELANYLDGRKFPGFDEPMEVTEEQRAALREIYKERS